MLRSVPATVDIENYRPVIITKSNAGHAIRDSSQLYTQPVLLEHALYTTGTVNWPALSSTVKIASY